jgi:protein-arginine kinase activator protein McsA
MGPEEFFHLDRISESGVYEMRVKSLGWVLDCYRIGKIRKNTIINLIDKEQLYHVLEYLIDKERYEQCAIVRDILNEVYNGKYEEKTN